MLGVSRVSKVVLVVDLHEDTDKHIVVARILLWQGTDATWLDRPHQAWLRWSLGHILKKRLRAHPAHSELALLVFSLLPIKELIFLSLLSLLFVFAVLWSLQMNSNSFNSGNLTSAILPSLGEA